MTLILDLAPELERALAEEAARKGQDSAGFARSVLEERLTLRSNSGAKALAKLLDDWDQEDSINPDPDPVPIPPRLSIRSM